MCLQWVRIQHYNNPLSLFILWIPWALLSLQFRGVWSKETAYLSFSRAFFAVSGSSSGMDAFSWRDKGRGERKGGGGGGGGGEREEGERGVVKRGRECESTLPHKLPFKNSFVLSH